ncbi:MAG: hypothetical protein AB7S26_01755 [Sandaracinaceae bacterium]
MAASERSRCLVLLCAGVAACTPDFDALQHGLDDGGADAAVMDAGARDAGARIDGGAVDGAPPDGGLRDGGDVDACAPSDDVCDGVDADCDGSTDEDAACGGGLACREGMCLRPGGALLASRLIGATGPAASRLRDRARAIATLSGGGLVVAGDTEAPGTIDFGTGALTPTQADGFVVTFDRDLSATAAMRIGGGNFDDVRATTTLGARFAIGGQVVGTVDLGAGAGGSGTTGYVAVYDSAALTAHHASRRIGPPSAVTAIARLGTDLVIVGTFATTLDLGAPCVAVTPPTATGHMFAARITGGGVPVWCTAIPSTANASANAVTVDDAGGVVLVGAFSGDLDLGPLGSLSAVGGFDAVAIQLDGGSGVIGWARAIGGSAVEEGTAVAALPGGDILVGGGYASADASVDGMGLPATSTVTLYLARLTSAGAAVWVRVDHAGVSSRAWALATDAAGRAVVHGEHTGLDLLGCPAIAGARDVFAARIDPADGQCLWLTTFGGAEPEFAGGIAIDERTAVLAASVNDGCTIGSTNVTTVGDDPTGDTDIAVIALQL